MRCVSFLLTGLLYLTVTIFTSASTLQAKRPFTITDEIGLTLFNAPNGGPPQVHCSPDGDYFAVWTERGRLDLDRPEDSLRFYRSKSVMAWSKNPRDLHPPLPIWVVTLSTDKQGPIINDWRWLADSSGVAFLQRTAGDNQRLVLADLRRRTLQRLSPSMGHVNAFDIRDLEHYVYTISDTTEAGETKAAHLAPAIVGTHHSLYDLLFPASPIVREMLSRDLLWAVVRGKQFQVNQNGRPLVLSTRNMALSPDGRYLATTMPVVNVPLSWEAQFPPPFPSSAFRIRAAPPHTQAFPGSVRQYVRINLQMGSVQALTGAPIGDDAGWWAGGMPSWSADGREIILPSTFLDSKDHAPTRPCVAVVYVVSNTGECVEPLKGHTETGVEKGYHTVLGAHFLGADGRTIVVIFRNPLDSSQGETEYQRAGVGDWTSRQTKGDSPGSNGLEIGVKQSFNAPPLLVATTKQSSRVIWDPNPQLKTMDLAEASVYTWRDEEGRVWRGALYKPSNYKMGQRYPLVIQTHGFIESEFRPSGVFPTAFAARALAAVGIVVLQAGLECPMETPSEGPCAVSGYEAGAKQLVSEGIVDPDRIGIIGFSRTCFYVMEALTTGYLHFKAASITDGIMETYSQYLLQVGTESEQNPETDAMIGGRPYGEGLQHWLKRSPSFSLDKVRTPLFVIATGPISLLYMWEPYAGLRFLHKPVELIMLNTEEHVLTNPGVRLASQGGSVDWFRFWLQDYEDTDLVKAEQYKRWRELKQMEEENEKKAKPVPVN